MKINDNEGRFFVEIKAKRNWTLIALIPILTLIMAFFGTYLILLPTVLGGFILLWMFTGKEIIEISENVVTLRKEMVFLKRKKLYDINLISDMARNHKINAIEIDYEETMKISNYFSNNGLIKFVYGVGTVKFAEEISGKEADLLMEKLSYYINNSPFEGR
jgi:hypothetical protein